MNVLVHVDGAGSGLADDDSAHYFGEPIEASHGAIWHIFSQVPRRALGEEAVVRVSRVWPVRAARRELAWHAVRPRGTCT